jgi:hypothetical protein
MGLMDAMWFQLPNMDFKNCLQFSPLKSSLYFHTQCYKWNLFYKAFAPIQILLWNQRCFCIPVQNSDWEHIFPLQKHAEGAENWRLNQHPRLNGFEVFFFLKKPIQKIEMG